MTSLRISKYLLRGDRHLSLGTGDKKLYKTMIALSRADFTAAKDASVTFLS